ncbi:MAG: hypothetical protein ACQEUT_12345 [Bacillota bacterium]
MDKVINFSVSTTGKNSEIQQTFTYEELNIDESLSNKEIEKRVHEIFKVWIWDNISFSCVIDGLKIEEEEKDK